MKPTKLRTNKTQDWHPEDIKAELHKAGSSFSKIAKTLGYKHHNIPNQVLTRPYPKIERAVADEIGVPPETIWPSRYERRARRAA